MFAEYVTYNHLPKIYDYPVSNLQDGESISFMLEFDLIWGHMFCCIGKEFIF